MSTITPKQVAERLLASSASRRPAVLHRRALSRFVLALSIGMSAICRPSRGEDLPGFSFPDQDVGLVALGYRRVADVTPVESRDAEEAGVRVFLHRYGGSNPRIELVCFTSPGFNPNRQSSIPVDQGLALFLGDLNVEIVGNSLLVKAGWRKGVTTYVQRFLCTREGGITQFEREERSDAGNPAFGGSERVFYTPRDPQRDIFDSIVSQEYDGTLFGPPTTHVPADPQLFRDELVVLHDPMANVVVALFTEGPFPFAGRFNVVTTLISSSGTGPLVNLSSSFDRANEGTGAITASGIYANLYTAYDDFRSTIRGQVSLRQSRFSPGQASHVSAPRFAELLDEPFLGNVTGGFYRAPRVAAAGHDLLVVVGLATEPPSFDSLVKAQLVGGDGTRGAVGTLRLPPFMNANTAFPVMGYRNELFVSAQDTLVPDEDSGLFRFPLTIDHPPCQANDTTLCLNGGRFKVELAWRNDDGRGGAGHARPLTGDTGTFWIFDPNNLEAAVKVLDAQSINDHFWVFAMGLTDLGIGITVTDTVTGQFATFFNTLGKAFAPYQNTQALPGDSLPAEVGWMDRFGGPTGDRPGAGAASSAVHRPRGVIHARSSRGSTTACTADATRLCLAGGRFEVSATFETAQGQSGAAQTVPITSDTGYLWFFDQNNVEALIKVLDACVINQRIWVFAGGLTDVKVVLTVRDSVTGQVRTYTNPLGTPFQPIQDTGAFATCS